MNELDRFISNATATPKVTTTTSNADKEAKPVITIEDGKLIFTFDLAEALKTGAGHYSNDKVDKNGKTVQGKSWVFGHLNCKLPAPYDSFGVYNGYVFCNRAVYDSINSARLTGYSGNLPGNNPAQSFTDLKETENSRIEALENALALQNKQMSELMALMVAKLT